jgi:hypothetical protein
MSPMSEILTITEIESRFPSEWVLIGNARTDVMHELQEGEIVWHSKDRDEVHRKTVELRPKRFAMVYTGTIPENTAIVL